MSNRILAFTMMFIVPMSPLAAAGKPGMAQGACLEAVDDVLTKEFPKKPLALIIAHCIEAVQAKDAKAACQRVPKRAERYRIEAAGVCDTARSIY